MSGDDVVRVLVAEDRRGMRGLLRELIDDEVGLEVVAEAVDGAEVLSQVEQARPDVVVLDLGLPVLDGEAVLERLQAVTAKPRVIIVSGQASAMVAPRLLGNGAEAIVEKGTPHWEQELISRIRPSD